ncbi:hypothetical protein PIB30_086544 [Stylosanthes scabra]|uniref:Putative plant transposon protein domain-containing protein n=1 Tax=Stylosanthes scabra TaxID=79078 RepID=A0ABU6WRH5_9FABA|nr:hypothetical protein [Stylosanthes scabra]
MTIKERLLGGNPILTEEEEEGNINKGRKEQKHHHSRVNHHVIRDPFTYNVGSLSLTHFASSTPPDRKRKGKAVFSSSQVTSRFKTLYHEAHLNSKFSARRILPELILQADEHVFNPIRFQIHQRKWEKFTKPIQAVGHLMVKEFYANAWEPDKAKRKPLTYTSMVRGTEVSFAPSNIKRVLKLKKDPLPDAPSYHERKANKDFRLDHILEDMCEEGAEWVHHRDGRPHYLRRSDLEPMPKG